MNQPLKKLRDLKQIACNSYTGEANSSCFITFPPLKLTETQFAIYVDTFSPKEGWLEISGFSPEGEMSSLILSEDDVRQLKKYLSSIDLGE